MVAKTWMMSALMTTPQRRCAAPKRAPTALAVGLRWFPAAQRGSSSSRPLIAADRIDRGDISASPGCIRAAARERGWSWSTKQGLRHRLACRRRRAARGLRRHGRNRQRGAGAALGPRRDMDSTMTQYDSIDDLPIMRDPRRGCGSPTARCAASVLSRIVRCEPASTPPRPHEGLSTAASRNGCGSRARPGARSHDAARGSLNSAFRLGRLTWSQTGSGRHRLRPAVANRLVVEAGS